MLCMQSMLRFKQTTRVSASDALKSKYFANAAETSDSVETANYSSASSSSLTSSDSEHDSDELDHAKVLTSSGV